MLRVSEQKFNGTNVVHPTVSPRVSLSWTVLPGVNNYYLWIEKNNGTSFVQITDPAPRSVTGGTFETTLSAGQYRVWVRDLNVTPPVWSPQVDFDVAGSQSPLATWLSSSASMAAGGALAWSPVAGAVRYEVNVAGISAGTSTFTSMVSGTEYRGNYLPPGNYNAWVRAYDAADRPLGWGTALLFSISPTTYNPKITSVPTGTQTNGVAPIVWNPGWADSYEVTLQTATGTPILREPLKGTSFTPSLLPAGTYNVVVKAFDSLNASSASYQTMANGNFTVDAATYKAGTPIFTQGANGSQLTWPQVNGAVRYDLWVDRVSTVGFTARSQLVREFRQDTTFDLDSRFDDGATYNSWVRPVFPDGAIGVWSALKQFVASPSGSGTVLIGQNAATGESLAPQFIWPAISGAAAYDVWVSKQDLSMPGQETATYFPVVTVVENRYLHNSSVLEHGSYLYWYKARNSSGVLFGSWSAAIPFTVQAAASVTIPNTLQIGLSEDSPEPVVQWDSVHSGLADIRVIRVEQPQTEVLREQYFVTSSSATRNSHALRGGLAPGLYRIDVGPRTSPTAAPGWVNGPVFYFDGSRINTLQATGAGQSTATLNVAGPFRGDFNGDGLQDLVKRTANTWELTVSINNSTALAPSPWNKNGTNGFTDFVSNQSTAPILVGDFNGDGRDDVVQPDMGSGIWSVMRSSTLGKFDKIVTPVTGLLDPDLPDFNWNAPTRTLTWNPVSSPNSNAVRTYELQIVRNGTAGITSSVATTFTKTQAENNAAVLSQSLTSLTPGEYTVFIRTSVNGRVSQWSEGFGISTNAAPATGYSAWQNYLVADFNGDHRDDIAAYNSVRQQWYVAISTGTSFEQTVWSSGYNFSGVYSNQLAMDVNGDGRKDIVAQNSTNQWIVNISTGTSFLTQQWAAPAFITGTSVSQALAADVNADGREDIVTLVGTNWNVSFSGNNAFTASSGGAISTVNLGMPSNTSLIDMNNDSRSDLVGFNAAGKSVVALATATGFLTPTIWEVNATTPWVIRLQDSGIGLIVADYNYRTRMVYEAFDEVHNTIEYEGYRGIKKGSAATLSTKSGNAWDQTNLLGTLISTGVPVTSPAEHAPFTGIKYATGTMTLTAAQVKNWLTTTTIPMDYFSQAGLNPVTVSTGVVKIDHAWLQAWLPTATGLGWVALNPAFKNSLSSAPLTSVPTFSATDLDNFLTPTTDYFTADFDAGGVTAGHHLPEIPPQMNFQSGNAIPVTNASWPKVGSVDDVKLETSHNAVTDVTIGEKAINGTLSASIIALQLDPQHPLQHFSVYARSTEDYEVGIRWLSGSNGPGEVYERHGSTTYTLASTITAITAGVVGPIRSFNVSGFMACKVDLVINEYSMNVYLQWISNSVTYGKHIYVNLTQSIENKPASRFVSGHFGFQTAGSGHHYLDDIYYEGTDRADVSPLSWSIDNRLKDLYASVRQSVQGIGQTRTIQQTSLATAATPILLTPASVSADQWAAAGGDYQTIKLRFVGPSGSTLTTTRPAGITGTPDRVADLARKRVVVKTSADGKTAQLFIDDELQETTTLSAPVNGVLQLESVTQVPGLTAEPAQQYSLTKDGTARVILRADQYSAADLAQVSDQLSNAYDQIPVTATGVPVTGYTNTTLIDKLLAYATVRLLTSSQSTEADISRYTDALPLRPSVSAGLISATSTLTYSPDSVYFARPSDLTVDFPVGKLLYVPRNGATTSQTDATQQSRYLLTLTELAAREHELLSEISEKRAMSALTFLQRAGFNDGIVRRLHLHSSSTPTVPVYVDDWDAVTSPTSNLNEFLYFGTGPNRTAAFTAIKQQIDAGGTVTLSEEFRTEDGWTGVGWLHENYTSVVPVIESLLMSDTDGRILHGGVLSTSGNDGWSNVSSLPDAVIAPDAYQGMLRKSDTDFVLSIPGISLPFTRTWTSSRSDWQSPNQVVTTRDISNLGPGWSTLFNQQLDISTVTESVLGYKKKKNWLRQVSQGAPILNNTLRKGEATVVAWRREDGTTGVFYANGTKALDGNGISVSADYDSPQNMPGTLIRRLDGGLVSGTQQNAYGNFYEVRMADGAVYKFKDYNSVTARTTGSTNALLISIADRFGNQVNIERDAADPSHITQIVDAQSARVLAKFRYMVNVVETDKGVSGGASEKQTLTLPTIPSNGKFVLTLNGQATAPISATATPTTVEAALELLKSSVGGNLSVTVTGPNGGPYAVQFGGNLSSRDVPMLSSYVTQIEVPPASTGSSPSTTVTGTRFWNYSYDDTGNLSRVTASESTGTAPNVQLTQPTTRYAYTWYAKTSPVGSAVRGDRLAGMMKSAAGFAGDSTDSGASLSDQFNYYGNGRLRTIQDAEGGEQHFIYDAFGNATLVVDAIGNVTINQFSDLGEMVASVSASGERTIYDIATNVARVARQTATSGRSESWEYDAKGNTKLHTDAAGISQIMTYHPVYNQIATIVERTAGGTLVPVMTNTYFTDNAAGHAIGALATSTDALTYATSYRYSTAATTTGKGLIAEITSPKGHSTQFDRLGYDVFGNPVVVDHRQFANNTLTTVSVDRTSHDNTGAIDYVWDYGSNGLLAKSTDFTYDQLGRLVESLAPDPYLPNATLRTQYLYGRNGLIEKRINQDGSIYRYEYDNAGRALREIRPDGTFTSVEYNVNGTVASQTDANGNKTRFVYDVLNRLSQTIFANGTTRSLLYNAKGDLISETDERGSITRYEYDAAGRLSKTIDPDHNETTIGYDVFGNQSTAESEMGVVTTTFNKKHQPIQVLYKTKATVNGAVETTMVRVDQVFYDGNGNQTRTQSFDLQSYPAAVVDVSPLLSDLSAGDILTLTDNVITTAEANLASVARRRITTTAFDFRDKPVSAFDAASNPTSQTYSLGTLLTSTTDARMATTRFGYDLSGSLQYEALPFVNSTDTKGLARVMRRDNMGRVVEVQETPYSLNAGVVNVNNTNNTNAFGEPVAPANSEAARITKTSFDALGRPAATQNAMGFVTCVTYDPAGNVVETIDASRRSTLSVLDSMNRVVKQVLPAVSVVAPSTSLTVVATTVMPVVMTQYDATGNVITATDPAGHTTTFQYDSLNRMILKTAQATDETPVPIGVNPTWSLTYDTLGHVATSTDPLERVTITKSDMFGQVLSTMQPDPDGPTGPLTASVIESSYDAFGNLLTVLDKGNLTSAADDRLTVNEYNSQNLKTKTTLPVPSAGVAASVLQWSFDVAGNLLSSTDARYYKTNYTYDAWNHVIKTELPAVAYGTGTARPTSLATYDIFGDLIRSTDAMGRTTTYQHDALGRTFSTVSPNPVGGAWAGLMSMTSTLQFDAVGNVIRVTDQLGRQTTTAYDSLNRPIRTTGTDPYTDDFETAPTTTVAYDVNGNVARQTDAAGLVTRFGYDVLNRANLVAVQNTTGWLTSSTEFDKAGNVKRTIDVREHVTDYNYDDWNRVIKVLQPTNSSGRPETTTTYDQFGNVKAVVDSRGGVTDFEYDKLNRLIHQLQPAPATGVTRPESVFAYDAAGNLYNTQVLASRNIVNSSNVENWTASVTTFDAINRPVNTVITGKRIVDGVTQTGQPMPAPTLTSQTYDLVGNVLTVTDAEGRVTAFEYDRLNRKITEIDPKPTTADANPITRFRYDNAGNLVATIDPLGRIATMTYDLLDRAFTTTSPDPDGPQGPLPAPLAAMRCDIMGNLLSTTDQLGRQTVSTYDLRNHVLTVTQPDADLTDNLSAPTASFVYNLYGDKIKAVDALGNVTDYGYDAIGRLTSTTLPDATPNDRLGRPVTHFVYDIVGNVVATTDPAGRITNNTYDLLNRLTKTQLPLPGTDTTRPRPTTLYQYDAVGNVVVTTDYISANVSRVTQNEYDYMNRITKTTLPSPSIGAARPVTTYEYDKIGNQTTVTQSSSASNAIQKTTKFVFDDLNRLVQTQSPNPTTGAIGGGPVSVSTFDLVGRLISSKDPLNRITSYFYDDLDRLTKVIGAHLDGQPIGNTTDKIPSESRTFYDAAGNVTMTQSRQKPDPLTTATGTSSLGIFSTTINRYDSLDRLTSTIDANGGVTQFRYDNGGNRIQLTDASFNTTRWQYDAQGQVLSETDPNRLSIVNEYDLVGNIFAVTDRRGYRTQFVRDNLDNVLQEHWLQPSGASTAFVSRVQNWYDSFNRVYWSRQTNPGNAQILSEVSLSYDNLDRVVVYNTVNTPGQSSAKLTYQYDTFGNRTQMKQETGNGASLITVTTNYTDYDYLNRLTKLNQTATNFPSWKDKSVKLAYRDDSSIQTITRYSHLAQTDNSKIVVKTDYTQDQAGRLSSITHTKTVPTSTVLAKYEYTYFADDQLLKEISSVDGTTNNDYDAYGQLVTSTKTAGTSEAYVYDKSGNRIVGSTVVGKGNRILNDGTYAYEYDGNGNLTRRTTLVNGAPSGAYIQYTWDHRNQLTKIEFYNAPVNGVWPLNKTVSYSYDVSSNRISKTLAVPGQTTVVENYVYDGDQLVAVMNATGAIQHEYFNGSSLDQVFADQTVLSGVLWPLEDRTGAARDVISTAGVVLDHRTLDSFGNISSRSGAWIDYDQFFSGLFYDADSQLYYARARWYDATSGKFIGEDPLRFGAGDTNLSRYGANDPINNADPSGMSWFSHALKQVGNAFEDVGHFVEKQWDNGNIQKGLLVAGTLASGGMLGFGLAAGTLGTANIFAGALGLASGVANSYEVFSGNRIGDGTFTRVLGAAAAVTGGFYAPGVKSFGTFGRGLSGASGLVSGYEIASGNTIGDGTLSSLFHVTNLGVNHGSTLFNANASAAQRFGVGLNLAVGGASVFNTGDRGLQQALRALSIASGVWNTGSEAVTAYQTSRATLEALRPTPIQARAQSQIKQVGYEGGGLFSVDDKLLPIPPNGKSTLQRQYEEQNPQEGGDGTGPWGFSFGMFVSMGMEWANREAQLASQQQVLYSNAAAELAAQFEANPDQGLYSFPAKYGHPATADQQKILALLVGPAVELRGKFDIVNDVLAEADDRQLQGLPLAPWHQAAFADYRTLRNEESHLGFVISQYGLDRFNVENATPDTWMYSARKYASTTSLLSRDIMQVVDAAYTPLIDNGRHGIDYSIGPVDIISIGASVAKLGFTSGGYALSRFAPQFAGRVAANPAVARVGAATAFGNSLLRSVHPVSSNPNAFFTPKGGATDFFVSPSGQISKARPRPTHANAHGFTLREINPSSGTLNCASCSVATDRLLSGAGHQLADLSGVTSSRALERLYGRSFVPSLSRTQLAEQLATQGNRGIVFGSNGAGKVGHFFNGVNQNGTLRFLDGQSGTAANLDKYVEFWFLPTK